MTGTHQHAPIGPAVATWIIAGIVALALSYAPDINTYTAASPDPVGDALERSRLADERTCQDLHGPESVAVQLPDGQHRCADKHGRRLSSRSAVTLAHRSPP